MQKKNIDMELSLTDDIDMHLIPDSIYNNIKVGNPLASKLDVIYAAEKAMVLDFAWEFPKGLDTFVDDERHPLSVEQKQQINLARIYLKNAQTKSGILKRPNFIFKTSQFFEVIFKCFKCHLNGTQAVINF